MRALLHCPTVSQCLRRRRQALDLLAFDAELFGKILEQVNTLAPVDVEGFGDAAFAQRFLPGVKGADRQVFRPAAADGQRFAALPVGHDGYDGEEGLGRGFVLHGLSQPAEIKFHLLYLPGNGQAAQLVQHGGTLPHDEGGAGRGRNIQLGKGQKGGFPRLTLILQTETQHHVALFQFALQGALTQGFDLHMEVAQAVQQKGQIVPFGYGAQVSSPFVERTGPEAACKVQAEAAADLAHILGDLLLTGREGDGVHIGFDVAAHLLPAGGPPLRGGQILLRGRVDDDPKRAAHFIPHAAEKDHLVVSLRYVHERRVRPGGLPRAQVCDGADAVQQRPPEMVVLAAFLFLRGLFGADGLAHSTVLSVGSVVSFEEAFCGQAGDPYSQQYHEQACHHPNGAVGGQQGVERQRQKSAKIDCTMNHHGDRKIVGLPIDPGQQDPNDKDQRPGDHVVYQHKEKR